MKNKLKYFFYFSFSLIFTALNLYATDPYTDVPVDVVKHINKVDFLADALNGIGFMLIKFLNFILNALSTIFFNVSKFVFNSEYIDKLKNEIWLFAFALMGFIIVLSVLIAIVNNRQLKVLGQGFRDLFIMLMVGVLYFNLLFTLIGAFTTSAEQEFKQGDFMNNMVKQQIVDVQQSVISKELKTVYQLEQSQPVDSNKLFIDVNNFDIVSYHNDRDVISHSVTIMTDIDGNQTFTTKALGSQWWGTVKVQTYRYSFPTLEVLILQICMLFILAVMILQSVSANFKLFWNSITFPIHTMMSLFRPNVIGTILISSFGLFILIMFNVLNLVIYFTVLPSILNVGGLLESAFLTLGVGIALISGNDIFRSIYGVSNQTFAESLFVMRAFRSVKRVSKKAFGGARKMVGSSAKMASNKINDYNKNMVSKKIPTNSNKMNQSLNNYSKPLEITNNSIAMGTNQKDASFVRASGGGSNKIKSNTNLQFDSKAFKKNNAFTGYGSIEEMKDNQKFFKEAGINASFHKNDEQGKFKDYQLNNKSPYQSINKYGTKSNHATNLNNVIEADFKEKPYQSSTKYNRSKNGFKRQNRRFKK